MLPQLTHLSLMTWLLQPPLLQVSLQALCRLLSCLHCSVGEGGERSGGADPRSDRNIFFYTCQPPLRPPTKFIQLHQSLPVLQADQAPDCILSQTAQWHTALPVA